MSGVGQFVTWTGAGAMKSLSSASIDEPEERLLTNMFPNALHVSGVKSPGIAERSILASPNEPASSWPPARTSSIVSALTPASAGGVLLGLRSIRLPQHGSFWPLASQSPFTWPLPVVSQVRSPRSGVPLPPKSYVIRMSPSVRLIV